MNFKILIYCFLGMTILSFLSCSSLHKNDTISSKKIALNTKHVLTHDERDALTPDVVIQEFIEGNERFKTSDMTYRNHSEEVRKTATDGQFPKAIVLSCVDSRVPVEDVFDQGLGDVFVARVAGNVSNPDIIGSMEFACKVSGAKVIIVMGHQHCGAVKGAIDNVNLGNITSIVDKIKPAVAKSQNFEGEKTSKNEAFVKTVAKNNIQNTINEIRSKSEILRTMERNGEIKIIGVFYTLRNGELEFIN
jgi:carbonic anhydrase